MRDILDLKTTIIVFHLSLIFILFNNNGLSQLSDCYHLDTISYIVVVQSPPELSLNNGEWYRENVYFRIPKDFILKGEDNVVDFFLRNTNNEFIMNGYSVPDTNDFVSVTYLLRGRKRNYKHYLKIRIIEFDEFYVKPITGIQYPFGDSIKFKDFPIRLEEVFVENKDTNFKTVLEMNLLYIQNGISFDQIDFWEYVREQRYIHRKYICE